MTSPSPSRHRALEKLKPGWWWLGDYRDAEGRPVQIRSRISLILSTTQIDNGARYVRLVGTDTTGEPVELRQVRGYAVLSLTGHQGARAGLGVAAVESEPV